MAIQRVSFVADPESITRERQFDCVWISFLGREQATPLASPSLQWLDWKMHGSLSRYIVNQQFKSKTTTFIPTMRKLPMAYLALDPSGAPDWTRFLRNCEGLQLRNVLFYCEDGAAATGLEKELKGLKVKAFPETISFASDSLTP